MFVIRNYRTVISEEFRQDVKFLFDKGYISKDDELHFGSQLQIEQALLDEDWETHSRPTDYPPLSTYGYRKRYMHSISEREKATRGWNDRKADLRIIFKVREVEKEIFYFAIGVRIKGFPKNPDDIWSLLRKRGVEESTGARGGSSRTLIKKGKNNKVYRETTTTKWEEL